MFFLFSNWFRVILGCPYIHNELKPNQALPSYHKQSWSTTVPKFLLKLIFLCLHPTQCIATANTATPFPMAAHGSQSVTLTTAIQEMQESKRFASRCTDVSIQFLTFSNCIFVWDSRLPDVHSFFRDMFNACQRNAFGPFETPHILQQRPCHIKYCSWYNFLDILAVTGDELNSSKPIITGYMHTGLYFHLHTHGNERQVLDRILLHSLS